MITVRATFGLLHGVCSMALSLLTRLLPLVVAQEYDTDGSGEIGEK